MVNLKHELTVDDLIVEYMVCKVVNGYDIKFLISEFITFLTYFEKHMPVDDIIYDGKKLFDRFFERKSVNDWCCHDVSINKKTCKPHFDMYYDEILKDYYISANYDLSFYDMCVINTYFMDKVKVEKIRNLICDYLINQPKRKIDSSIQFDVNELVVGKYVAALFLKNAFISKYQYASKNDCCNINQILLQMDFTKLLDLKNTKKNLLEFYDIVSKKIALLYHNDKKLKISTYNTFYLANSNYNLLIEGNQKLFYSIFDSKKDSLLIDLENYKFIEHHRILCKNDSDYYYDDDFDSHTISSAIDSVQTKKLVYNIDKTINKIRV